MHLRGMSDDGICIRIRNSQIGVQWPSNAAPGTVREWLQAHGYKLNWGSICRGKETWWCPIDHHWTYAFWKNGEVIRPEGNWRTFKEAKEAALDTGLEVCDLGIGGRKDGTWWLEESY